MKKQIKLQKNKILIIMLPSFQIAFLIAGLSLINSELIAIIVAFGIVFISSIMLIIFIINGTISRIIVSEVGIWIREKKKYYIHWEEFIDCEIIHPIGRGYHKITLTTKEKSYKIFNDLNAIEMLIKYCTDDKFLKKLIEQKDKSY